MSWSASEGSLDLNTLQLAYARGELDPERLIEALYARIAENRDPNVWIHLLPKETVLARARALGSYSRDARLPLWGIPFAVKDNIDVAGIPTTVACPDFAYVPEHSSPAVDRLLAAGAICLGKTNLDQFATGLVGTRSPYGVVHNVFNPEYLSGGSSSGSAVAVAAGQVSFALGTDTAGSGRVPAALNNVVGMKPTRDVISTDGLFPACRSLDCLSLFALGCEDAARIREIAQDAGSQLVRVQPITGRFRFGTPRASQLEFFGDTESEQSYTAALAALRELGGTPVEIDFEPFAAIGNLLYGGPWLAERVIAVGEFIRARPESCLPLTRNIIMAGERYSAADTFRALYELDALRERATAAWNDMDVLVLPTTPTIYTIAEDEREPRTCNDRLGIYTRFVNFLSYPALSVPAGFKPDGLPFGITMIMPRHKDRELDAFGLAFERKLDVGPGRSRVRLANPDRPSQRPPAEASNVRVAVVGAHLRGLPLNPQLIEHGARFVKQTRTAAKYKLFLLAGTKPLKPGLLRVSQGGAAIEIELWDVPSTSFGGFVDKISAPLGIGSLQCEDGEVVKGFVCESYALEGAEDITKFGGFRAYLEQASVTDR